MALQVLNAVAQLFALRYAICMLEADPVTWIRCFRYWSRCAFASRCQSLPVVVVGSMCIEIQWHVTAIHSIHNHLIHDEVSIQNLGICNKIGFLLSHGTVAFFGTTTANMHNIMIYHNALNIFEHLGTFLTHGVDGEGEWRRMTQMRRR